MRAAAAPRVRLAVVGVACVAAVGLLAASSLGDNLIYYRTPGELATQPAVADGRVRLGGLVQRGSVRAEQDGVRFVLTDGAADITVVHRGDPPGVFQEGQGALVEGALDAGGVFRSDVLIVKHSNEYRSAEGDPYRPPEAGS